MSLQKGKKMSLWTKSAAWWKCMMLWLSSGRLRWVWIWYWWYSPKCNTTVNKRLNANTVIQYCLCQLGTQGVPLAQGLCAGLWNASLNLYSLRNCVVRCVITCFMYIIYTNEYHIWLYSGDCFSPVFGDFMSETIPLLTIQPVWQDVLHMSLIRTQPLWKIVRVFLYDYF